MSLFYISVPAKPEVEEPTNKGDICKLHTKKEPEQVTTGDGCRSIYMYNITSCKGNCDSSSVATTGDRFYDAKCSCCQPAIYETIDIPVKCEGDVERMSKFTTITKCKCDMFKCQAMPSHERQIQVNEEGEIVDNSMKKKRRRRALSRLFALPP